MCAAGTSSTNTVVLQRYKTHLCVPVISPSLVFTKEIGERMRYKQEMLAATAMINITNQLLKAQG